MEAPKKRHGYYHASASQFVGRLSFAQQHRQGPTKAERALWQKLKGNKICGCAFRRQFIIDRYIVDFVCLDRRLIIEVDGDYHLTLEQMERDKERADDLEALGFRVIRFRNEEVLQRMHQVLQVITKHLLNPHTPQS
ncbi:endonuclease domain-containing protein [Flaviaesturariibacter aridisoli]|uniref:Endonuclease domain-containing protein n=1 Tax=Flaviaesturariibacter aridisoli TaxID=2545761 RepID=A0A4R4DXK9_9BACT|nr:endonuclease domain-containing protein [Flaviaesturariibacter aridisoli]TCZ68253.1 endonuclease domain-containing protein [Flaviaesturariibacter aridisoli]